MKNIKELWIKYRKFLIAPLGVSLILFLLYFIKGIYPFGDMTIANADMGQSYMTFYHFLYDVVYNGKNLFYDYNLGMGSNMYGGFIIDGVLNPFTWIILITGRENIANMFSFVLILKIAFIALTAFILFNKLFKKNQYYNIIFAMLYALSAYVLMYNTNIMWLDVVGLFPLFILATKHMFETNKIYLYSICLTLMLLFNYNLSYMVLMFIIFILPIYIKLALPKEKRKQAVYNIIIGTVLSAALSAFAIIPAFIQTITSYRMSGSINNTVQNTNILFKIVVFLFYSLPLYGFIKWLKCYKEDKTNIKIVLTTLLFTVVIPIIFERVNLLWHTGSYQSFPYRYGFIPILILYLGALRYFANFYQKEKIVHKYQKIILEVFAVILFIITILVQISNAISINQSIPAFELELRNFIIICITAILMIFVITIVHNIENRLIKNILLTGIISIEILIYSYAYIGVEPAYRNGREWSDEPIFTSYEIANSFNIEDSLYRIKDLTGLTSENCPLVYNIPSMATFLHIISDEQVKNAEQLGYSHNRTKINGLGGTVFSDAIYGVKYVLTKKDLPNEIYKYVSTSESGIKLYEYINTLPLAFTYQNEIIDIPKDLRVFEVQNYVYQKLFNKSDSIITTLDNNSITTQQEDKNYQYTIKIKDRSILYMHKGNIALDNITVNGRKIIMPVLEDEENTIYPISNNNGILDLGIYENEIVTISMERIIGEDLNDLQFGILNLDKYYKMFQQTFEPIEIKVEKNEVTISANVEKDSKLFIPINYDKGWHAVENNPEIKRTYNNFIGIELKEGKNNIKLRFVPYLFIESTIITVITIIAMIICYFIGKKFEIRNISWLMNSFFILGIIIYAGALWKVYIVSIIDTFIR